MHVRHVIFDLNGTLADTKRAFIATRHQFIERLGTLTGVSREQLFFECRNALRGNSLNPDIAPSLPSLVKWQHSDDGRARAVQEEVQRFRAHVTETYRASSCVRATLAALRAKGCRLSVWSASRAPYVIDTLLLLGFDGLIDVAFCSAQMPGVRTSLDGRKLVSTELFEFPADSIKPSSDSLLAIVNRAGVPEGRTLLVSNSIVSDGRSVLGTDVGFVLLEVAPLSEHEQAREREIVGPRGEANAGPPNLSTIPLVARIGCLQDLLNAL